MFKKGVYLQSQPHYPSFQGKHLFYQPSESSEHPYYQSFGAQKRYDAFPASNMDNQRIRRHDTAEDGRLLSDTAFSRISETLGALNAVGRYIVNMTRGGHDQMSSPVIADDRVDSSTENIPDAILTLTKNVLGENVEKTIEPLIKRVSDDIVQNDNEAEEKKKKRKNLKKDEKATVSTTPRTAKATTKPTTKLASTTVTTKKPTTLSVKATTTTTITTQIPRISIDDIQEKDSQNRCQTPEGKTGRCEDLSNCPALLLDLTHLRESLCFKSLFVPGVCCPLYEAPVILTTPKPVRLTTRPTPPSTTTKSPRPVTQKPSVPVFTLPNKPVTISNNNLEEGSVIDPSDCGQQEYTSGRIVGGIESPNGEWPWMAAIFLHGTKRTEFWCGGSLIGTKYILTAAHCTKDSKQRPFAARQFTVRLGDIDLSKDSEPSAPQTYRVTEVRAHQQFSRVGFYNDIAILVLDRPVRKSKYIIPVCLPNPVLASKERLPGRRATVVGWGTTYYGGKESTSQRQAALPLWRNEDCNRAYFQPITDNFLCAGYSEGGVDACQGDSGGPLMMQMNARWTQLGIVSFGNKCGEPGYPGVYTRITEYLDWIQQNTRN